MEFTNALIATLYVAGMSAGIGYVVYTSIKGGRSMIKWIKSLFKKQEGGQLVQLATGELMPLDKYMRFSSEGRLALQAGLIDPASSRATLSTAPRAKGYESEVPSKRKRSKKRKQKSKRSKV